MARGLRVVAWLTGDITNLVGCILTDTTKTQLYTAVYFCFIDGIMVAQWLYYSHKNKVRNENDSGLSLNSVLLPLFLVMPIVGAAAWYGGDGESIASPPSHHHGSGRVLLGIVVARVR